MRSTLFILWLLSAIPVYAQSDSLHIYSMQEVYQQNNWLTGANPVGMSFNRFRSFSVAEVGYRFEDGNFGNVSLPASSNKYAVFGESYQTIGNVSLYGKIGYVNNRKQFSQSLQKCFRIGQRRYPVELLWKSIPHLPEVTSLQSPDAASRRRKLFLPGCAATLRAGRKVPGCRPCL